MQTPKTAAITLAIDQLWESVATGNRWKVISVHPDGDSAMIKLVSKGPRDKGTYSLGDTCILRDSKANDSKLWKHISETDSVGQAASPGANGKRCTCPSWELFIYGCKCGGC